MPESINSLQRHQAGGPHDGRLNVGHVHGGHAGIGEIMPRLRDDRIDVDALGRPDLRRHHKLPGGELAFKFADRIGRAHE